MNHSEIVSFLWGVADLIRDTFKRGKYQDVILPLTVLRRIDCVLAPTKEKVLASQRQATAAEAGQPRPPAPQGRRASPSTTPPATTSRSCWPTRRTWRPTCATTSTASPTTCARCWRSSTSTTPSAKLDEAGLLFLVMERFKNVDLHPDRVDNHTMGTIFEELIRKFNEALEREPRRALHAPRGDPPDGRPAAGRRRAEPGGKRAHRPHRLRSLLRLGRHADHRQGARTSLRRRSTPQAPTSTCSARR